MNPQQKIKSLVEVTEKQRLQIASLQQIIREDLEDDVRARDYAKDVIVDVDNWCELSAIVKLLVDDVKRLRREKQELTDSIQNTLS